ncbi:unnamed protein product [Paramecium sonneborni]|uniref:Importin N-terminal domain-containing protein n=1 Tax=Paramecium sonneborni TaxID=65129 RepID=A0A8S1LA70_9CILI|nr:unnamed protein product [Paramecium sonneborni]
MQNQLCERIFAAYTSIDQNLRKSAEEYLNNLEEQDSNLSFYLLEIISIQQQNSQIRLFTIILLKNVIKRKWNAFGFKVGSEQRKKFYQEDQKKQIKTQILSIYCQEVIGQIKQEALQILLEICENDYPFRYPELLQYINQQLQVNNQDQQLFLLLKQLFKFMQKNQQKNDQYNLIWEKIAQQWIPNDNLNKYSQHFLLLLDKVFTNFILSYQPIVFQNDIQQIFRIILQKIALLLEKNQQQYNKNITHLISKCSKLFEIYTFDLSQILPDYLQLLSISINSNNIQIIKSGLIAFIRFQKLSQLFLPLDKLQLTFKNKPVERQQHILNMQQIINQILQQFYEKESQNFLQKILVLINQSNEIGIEDMIEQEEENEFEKILHPKDAEVFNLALIAVELLIFRAPQICQNILQGYIDQTIQAQFQVNPKVLDGLLIIIGLIPKIQSKLKISFQIQYPVILQYLQSSNQLTHQRRLSILLNRLILIVDQNQILQFLEQAGTLLSKNNDSVVQYQCLLCIKQVATNYNGNLAWTQILVTVCPFLVQLLKNLVRTSIINPLLELLTKLIEKCQNEQSEVVIIAIRNSGLLELMKSKFQEAEENTLIIEQVCQMLKTLIVAYPIGSQISHIFEMALVLIRNNINSKQTCILELTLLLLREYEDQYKNFQINELIILLNQNFNSLLSDTSQINSCVFISIIEELYLLGVFTINDIQNHITYIENKYSQKDNNVKNSILGLTTTMILLILNQNRKDIGIFTGLIQLIINDLLEPKMNETLENKFRIEIQIISILNRFIILARNDFFTFVQQNNVTFDNYLQSWLKKSEILESEKTIKLNIIAFLIIIDQLEPNQFIQYFILIAKQFARYLKMQKKNQPQIQLTPTNRLSQHRTSSRKEIIRQTQMHNEENLQQFFNQIIQDYIIRHNLQQDQVVIQASQILI